MEVRLNHFKKLEVDVATTKKVNDKLFERLFLIERHCWKLFQYSQGDTLEIVGIPSSVDRDLSKSFTIVRFLTKIQFSNVVEFRLGSQDAVSSAVGSCRSPGGGSGGKPLKHFDLFWIWRTNK